MADSNNNEKAFDAWVAEREAAGDWKNYIRRGILNRTEIKNECRFSRSVLGSNPAIKEKLRSLEQRLREGGVLPYTVKGIVASRTESVESHASAAMDKRILSINNQAANRVKRLEEENAALRAEIRQLREELRRYRHISEHMSRAGRLVRP